MTKKEKDFLNLYFSRPKRMDSNYEIKSPYTAALIDSRIATGRNKASGKKLKKSHGSWIGSLGYMALLDHVGKIIKMKNKNKEGNSFINSLFNFSNLNEREVYALYSLRCSFAHDYSLFNIPKDDDKKRDLKIHRFSVSQGVSSNLITFPKNKWNGDFKNEGDVTSVNLELFCDLVESIHKKIINEINKNNLELLVSTDDLFVIKYQV